jgi:transposase
MNNADKTQEIIELKQRLAAMELQLSKQNNALENKDHKIETLEEYIRYMVQQHFGSSSEKLSADQINLFDEAELLSDDDASDEEEECTNVPAHKRKKKRASIPKELPRTEVIHDLTDEEKVCPHDGIALRHFGNETSEQLDYIPAQMSVLQHVRQKYTCPCCNNYMVTASKPVQSIEKPIASPGLLAQIATHKYCDALPLYRQAQIFKRFGVELDRTSLANWMIKCGILIQPLINLMYERAREGSLLYMDETVLQVLKESERSAQQQSRMWVMTNNEASARITLFHYSTTRKTSEAGKANTALAFIQKLFRIKKLSENKSIDEKYQIREVQTVPLLDELRQWLDKTIHRPMNSEKLKNAVMYLHNQWPKLIRYTENGAWPIDNNAAENAIRPMVVGRKNWLFAATEKGAKASANLYSLVETAKANNVEQVLI